jgi:uncharacterized protein (TIGR04141 family)
LDWEKVVGFKYTQNGNIYDDMDIDDYFGNTRIDEFDIDKLKHRKVIPVDSDGKELYKWSVYECIVIETKFNNVTYVLTSGIWFELEGDFVQKINDFIDNTPDAIVDLPSCNKNYSEGKYNDKVGDTHDDILTMDRKLVRIDGNDIEICDLLTKNKQFIHVKP